MSDIGSRIEAVTNGGSYRLNAPDWHVQEGGGADFFRTLYKNLFSRTSLIYSVRRFRAAGRDERARRLPTYRDDVRISCISSPIWAKEFGVQPNVPPNQVPDLEGQKFRDQCQLLRVPEHPPHTDWMRERERELEKALEFEPHVICFGELAYPPPQYPADGGWSTEDVERAVARRRDFEAMVTAKLNKAKQQPFIFLGSYHCLMTLYNIGVLLPWGAAKGSIPVTIEREDLEDLMPEYDDTVEHPSRILYRKRFPARRVNEATRVPHDPEMDIFQMPFGQVTVLICSDVVDLNQFMAIAHKNRVDNATNRIDYVFVPSLNRSRKLVSMCQELSYIAATTVIMVNANHGLDGFPVTRIFCCGIDASEVMADAGPLQQQQLPHYVSHGNGRRGCVLNFTFDSGLYRILRGQHIRMIQEFGAPSMFADTNGT